MMGDIRVNSLEEQHGITVLKCLRCTTKDSGFPCVWWLHEQF